MYYRKSFMLVTVIIIFISGCAICPPVDPQQKLIMQLDDYLIPLSKAIDVIADTLPQNFKDEDIFSQAVERSGNPNLLMPFEGYVRKARIEEGTGIILLCSPDGKYGIIEDVTCTTRPDMHRPTGSPCTYLLDVKKVCASP